MKKIFLITLLLILSSLLIAQDVEFAPVSEDYLNYLNTQGCDYNYGCIPLPFDVINNYSDEDVKVNIPTKFDLRDSDFILPVRNQSPYECCWAFATAAAVESNALCNGYKMNYISPLNIIDNNPFGYLTLNSGGNAFHSMAYFSNFRGPVDEEDAPYKYPYRSPSGLDVVGFCNKAEFYDDSESGLSSQELKIIKERIYSKGAVCASMYIANDYLKGYNYYCPKDITINHMVTFVGWDDNYSKSNFRTTPKGNGAFLVKNSYGTSWGNSGYFWISYYDATIKNIVGFEFTKKVNFEKLYSYNKSAMTGSLKCRYGKINYTTGESGTIRGIQTYCMVGGATFKATVKINNVAKGTITQKINYSGFVNIDVDKPIAYSKGDNISVYLDYNSANDNIENRVPIEAQFKEYVPTSKQGTNYYSTDNKNYIDVTKVGNVNIAAGIMTKQEEIIVLPTKIELNATSVNLNIGATKTLTATVLPSNATDKKVIWESSDTSVATVDANGKITSIKTGSAEIKCVSNATKDVYAICKVTVAKPIAVTKVSLSKTSLSIIQGQSATLKATVSPTTATIKTVKWTSSDKKIATVTSSGVVKAVKTGTCNIIVTTDGTDKNGKKLTATCKVKVVAPTYLTKVSLSKTSLSIMKGGSVTLTATVLPSNATYKTVKWTTTNTKVATVSSKGVVKAIKAGTCYIKVTTDGTDKNGKKLTASCKVTVTEPVYVTNLTLSKTSLTLKKGKTYTLKATVSPSNATVKTVKWSSTNTKIATVTEKGLVKAVKAGTCYIKVITDGKNKSGKQITKTCKIIVK